MQQIPSSKICRKVYDANIKHYEKEKKYQEQFSIFLVLIFEIICYIEIKEGGQRKGCLTSQTCWKLVYITSYGSVLGVFPTMVVFKMMGNSRTKFLTSFHLTENLPVYSQNYISLTDCTLKSFGISSYKNHPSPFQISCYYPNLRKTLHWGLGQDFWTQFAVKLTFWFNVSQ